MKELENKTMAKQIKKQVSPLTWVWVDQEDKTMNVKKQSSIDWLLKKIWWEYRLIPNDDIIEEAKAMHKEEIMKAANNGCKGMCYIDSPKDGEQYYNETFNQ